MITVDCKDVESILHELAIYVADQVAAMPAMKFHKFVLAPIVDDEPVDQTLVITAIKEFLESIGEKPNFGVISNGENVIIKSISGKKIEREAKPVGEMFSCAHCGHVTRYEVEHFNHVKIHYL
jgi:predicted methyltransferase MtxX (methanogen marker protein 4)|tara:strand:- start:195 stop:563 length:369 start_codon:yes stop_codon:yes gene_type:complete